MKYKIEFYLIADKKSRRTEFVKEGSVVQAALKAVQMAGVGWSIMSITRVLK